jgi:hypothetical protein
MALTDIVSEAGESSAAARGNVGVITDALSRDSMSNSLFLTVPLASQVETGVVFGPQDGLTGSFAGGGGGGTVWLRAR